MNSYYLPHAAALLASALFMLILASRAWEFRKEAPAAVPLALLLISSAIWSTASAIGNLQMTLPRMLFWGKVEYLGIVNVPPLWLLFALFYTYRQQWLSPARIAALWVIPLLTLLLAITNEWHGLIWSRLIELQDPAFDLIWEHGPFFWLAAAYNYILFFAGMLLIINSLPRRGDAFRQQGVLVVLAAFCPLLANLLHLLGTNLLGGVDPTPLGFLLGGFLFYWNLSRYLLFDLIPVARDILIESMRDSILLLDHRQRLVDINPAARALLNLPTATPGTPLAKVMSDRPHLAEALSHVDNAEWELPLDGASTLCINLQGVRIYDARGGHRGQLITLRDVTRTRRIERELRAANHRLKEQLAEIEGLHTELREQAIRDPLTGLYNRRYLEEFLERELARAAREDVALTLVILDIDRFKALNDTFGHPAGDLVLQELGTFLMNSIRKSDIACRLGGEEFVLILPSTRLSDAHRRAEQLCQAFQEHPVLYGDTPLRSTLSVGLAVFPYDGTNADALLAAADRAMYAAKAAGGNVVRRATEEDRAG